MAMMRTLDSLLSDIINRSLALYSRSQVSIVKHRALILWGIQVVVSTSPPHGASKTAPASPPAPSTPTTHHRVHHVRAATHGPSTSSNWDLDEGAKGASTCPSHTTCSLQEDTMQRCSPDAFHSRLATAS